MLVLEGPDGGGKTYLAQQLVKALDLEYRKPSQEVLSSTQGPVNPRALIEWWMIEVQLCEEDPAYERRGVYDRTTYISDPIYRLVYGEHSAATVRQMRRGIDFLADNAMIVWCIPPWDVTLESLRNQQRDNLEWLDETKAGVVWWAYSVLMATWQAFSPERNLHYHRENYDQILDEIKEYLHG